MARLSRKERERLRHRREVLEAAEALFAQKGFANTTMHEIAERSEFAVGSLYNMFENKLAIYFGLVHMRANQYIAQVQDSIARQRGAVEKIRAVVRTKLRFFAEHQQFFRIFSHATSAERTEPPFGMLQKTRKMYRDYMGALAEVFKEGTEQGIFVALEPTMMVLSLEGITNSIVGHYIHTGGEQLEAATAESVEKLLFEGILRKELYT